MSIDLITKYISDTIKYLEQGEFQTFCEQFFPIYNNKYKNLVRKGKTASGKTRPGTPDSIITDKSGNNIAFEYSTLETYWIKPKDDEKIIKWKPIEDINKNIKKTENLIEIVIASNQELPATSLNIKSDIIEYTKEHTTAELTIFSLEDFEAELTKNSTKYLELIKIFFSHIHKIYVIEEKLKTLELKVKLHQETPASWDDIQDVLTELSKKIDSDIDQYELALTELTDIKSIYQQELPDYPKVSRFNSILDYIDHIEGKIISVIGIPKIGKTSWLIQNCHDFKNAGYEILWFNSPNLNVELPKLYSDIAKTLLSKFINPEIAKEYEYNKVSLDDLLPELSQVSKSQKYLLVIDNAEVLTKDILKEFNHFFQILKQAKLQSKFSILLISNRNLTNTPISLDCELKCPPWDKDELINLLKCENIKITDDIDSYCKLLEARSGGHPLYAIALANKAPTITELITYSKNKDAPELDDKDLTDDIKYFLFEDMLSETDYQNFVIRLSPLIYMHDKPLILKLCDEVKPHINTPINLMLEKLDRSIIEGDEKMGYGVSLVFKNVASTHLDDNKKNEILDKASEHLLQANNNVINSEDYIEGIMYSTLSKNIERALLHTSILLYNANLKLTDDLTIKYILTKLYFITLINPPENINQKRLWIFALFNFANAYSKINDNEKAIELYKKIVDQDLNKQSKSDDTDELSIEIDNSILIYIFGYFTIKSRFNDAITIVNDINVDTLPIEISNTFPFLDALGLLIQKCDSEKFPKVFLYQLIEKISKYPDQHNRTWGELAACFQAIGLKLSSENPALENQEISKIFSDNSFNNPIWNLFINITIAQYNLELRNNKSTIKIIESIFNEIKKLNIKSNLLKSKLYMMQGDSYYKDKNVKDSATNYREASNLLTDTQINFDHAWINYRLGICTDNYDEALNALDKAKKYFTELGDLDFAARCEGEKSIVYYLDNKFNKTIETIESIFKELECGKEDYNPTATIGISLLSRLNSELRNTALPSDENNLIYPKFNRGLFENILKTAKPKSKSASALFIIAECYEALDIKDKHIELLNKILESKPEIDQDNDSKLLAIYDLIEIYLEEYSHEDIERVIDVFINIQYEKRNTKLQPISILQLLDISLKNKKTTYTKYIDCLDIIENSINRLDDHESCIWKSEIYKRKAGLDGASSKDHINEANLTKAYTLALECNHHELIVELGHIIGFEKHLAQSIKHLGNIHLEILGAICNVNRGEDVKINNLVTVGDNLFKVWLAISPLKLIESDYPFLINVKNRAKNLQDSKILESLIPPLMILLLISLAYDKSKYEYAINWAENELKPNIDDIPNDELKYLQKFYEI